MLMVNPSIGVSVPSPTIIATLFAMMCSSSAAVAALSMNIKYTVIPENNSTVSSAGCMACSPSAAFAVRCPMVNSADSIKLSPMNDEKLLFKVIVCGFTLKRCFNRNSNGLTNSACVSSIAISNPKIMVKNIMFPESTPDAASVNVNDCNPIIADCRLNTSPVLKIKFFINMFPMARAPYAIIAKRRLFVKFLLFIGYSIFPSPSISRSNKNPHMNMVSVNPLASVKSIFNPTKLKDNNINRKIIISVMCCFFIAILL